MELKGHVLSGLKWTAGVKFFTQIVNWTFTIIVIRLLQPNDYGLLAMATIFTSLCLLLNEMGLGAAIVQARQLTENILRQALGLIILLNSIIVITLFFFAPFIADIFDEPRLSDITRVLSLQFPIMAYYVVPNSLLIREMKFKSISLVGIFAELSNGICTLTLAWFGFGVWSLVIGTIIRVVVLCIGINIVSPFIRWPSFNFSGFTELAKFGGLISVQRVLWYFYSQADVFIIGRILGSTILGYYSIAMHIASLPLQKVGSIFSQVGLPAYSKLQDDPGAVSDYVFKVSRLLGVIGFPIFFGISSISPELVTIVLSEKWLPSILPLQLLSLIIPLRALNVSFTPAVNGIGRPDIIANTLGVACVIMPVAFLIGVNWGLTGVSIAWIVGYLVWFIYLLIKVLPVLGLKMKKFFRALYPSFICATTMYASIYACRMVLNYWQFSPIPTLSILISCGVIIYTGQMYIIFKKVCKDCLSMIQKKAII
ncbi:MAG: hypothetical protein DRP46_00380 [Candidatus Zixiibacteriota bacterium]|nr:MAG: hypothetical protein DRP46_00380 [candidate division Zixibacteria bacterium]